jgi:hypothetical protein
VAPVNAEQMLGVRVARQHANLGNHHNTPTLATTITRQPWQPP